MGGFENRANLHRELLAAIGTLAEANAGFAQVIMLAAYRTAMRANRAFRPQNAFEMSESGAFIMKVRSGHCGNGRHVLDSYCGIELSISAVVCQLRNRLQKGGVRGSDWPFARRKAAEERAKSMLWPMIAAARSRLL
jgi:hypothetical protein